MIHLALAASLLLSAENPQPTAQSYQAREKGRGHGVAPAEQTAGVTTAPAARPAAQPAAAKPAAAPAGKPAAAPRPSAYSQREKGGHVPQPGTTPAPAGGEQK